MTDTQTFCPKHFTLDGEDCFDGLVDCPPRVEVDPTKHLIIRCGPCDRTRVIPVDRVMRGKTPKLGSCSLDVCAAQLVLPEVSLVAAEEARLSRPLTGAEKSWVEQTGEMADVMPALGTGHDPDTATNAAEVPEAEGSGPITPSEALAPTDPIDPTPPSINQAAKPRAPKKATSGKASQ